MVKPYVNSLLTGILSNPIKNCRESDKSESQTCQEKRRHAIKPNLYDYKIQPSYNNYAKG